MRSQNQYTIYSLNDVVTSATAPSNPYKGQLWVNTSKSPPITMVWNGTKWAEQNGTDTIRSSISTITTKQAEFETNLNGLTSSVSSVTKKVETVESDLSAAESTILSMQTDISTLQQTATEISADVSKKADAEYGSETSSFGWKLKSDGFYLYSNATTVMSVTSSKLTVSGEIVATSGTLSELTVIGKLYFGNNKSYYIGPNYNNGAWYIYLKNFRVDETNAYFSGNLSAPTGNIGGFTLSSASLYTSGKTTYNSTTAGVYIGTNGIGLGAGTFYVTSAGKLYASNAEISGTITATSGTIGGFTIGESSLSNASGGSSIEITSGDYQTKLGANYIYSRVYSSAGSKGWSLSLDEFTISAYVSSVYAGIKILPYYKKRTSTSVYTSTTVAEGCITSYSDTYLSADSGSTIKTGTPFIIGMSREYAKSPYIPSHEWGAYVRFASHQLAELVYDSAYSGKWQLRNVSGSTYDMVDLLSHVKSHKFYFWTYTSSVSNDSRVSITKTTHGLSTVSGAIVIPREKSINGEGSGLGGDNNLINKRANYGVYITGTTVYIVVDSNGLPHGFNCIVYGY